MGLESEERRATSRFEIDLSKKTDTVVLMDEVENVIDEIDIVGHGDDATNTTRTLCRVWLWVDAEQYQLSTGVHIARCSLGRKMRTGCIILWQKHEQKQNWYKVGLNNGKINKRRDITKSTRIALDEYPYE